LARLIESDELLRLVKYLQVACDQEFSGCMTVGAGAHVVMLSEAKHLNVSQRGKVEILRFAQDDRKGRRICHAGVPRGAKPRYNSAISVALDPVAAS
jgi:hypothetical protein